MNPTRISPSRPRSASLVCAVVWLLTVAPFSSGVVWQYWVPVGTNSEQRAYLWVAPDSQRVRGLIIGLQNMLEKPMFQDPVIREAAADAGLAIVWVSPGSIGKADPALGLKFGPLREGGEQRQQVLVDSAKESGYVEIEFAPILAVGHLAATPFVWSMADWNSKRVFAILPKQ